MYVILSTWPKHSDGNVGDKLLEEQCKYLIKKKQESQSSKSSFKPGSLVHTPRN